MEMDGEVTTYTIWELELYPHLGFCNRGNQMKEEVGGGWVCYI